MAFQDMPDVNRKNVVQSAAKVFAVLRAFDVAAPELTISEVAERAGLDRGTAFRLIHTLCRLGYLSAVSRSSRFRLTLQCLDLGYSALSQTHLTDLALPLLRALVPDMAEAASLGVLDGADVVYVQRAQVETARDGLDRRIGRRFSAYASALGHAILAFLPRDRQIEVLSTRERVKLSERTLIDLDALLERLALVRRQGYAVSDGENAYGLRTIAAPLLDADGCPCAGVSLTIGVERMSIEAFVASALPAALRVAGELARALERTRGAVWQGAPAVAARAGAR
jgi:IclR family pca regulon transcriptional regulator